MLKSLLTILVAITVSLAAPAWSYDTAMAESYAELFAPVKGAGAGKAMHLMYPDAFLDMVKTGQTLAVLDIRTPAETAVFSSTLPGTLVIPLDQCKSGTRATAAGTALRHIGFGNVYILKGGFKALITYMGPKEANTPPAAKPAGK